MEDEKGKQERQNRSFVYFFASSCFLLVWIIVINFVIPDAFYRLLFRSFIDVMPAFIQKLSQIYFFEILFFIIKAVFYFAFELVLYGVISNFAFPTYMILDIVIILALVLFLLSRTKSSPVKLSFLTALKFDMFATLSPAIIGMIISLFWSAIAYIGFIICFGIRATFLGMKTTSPNNNQPDTVRK